MFQLLDPKALWDCVCALHYREATKMEARVLSLIVEGYRNDEIAAKLNRSPTTVRRHISELCEKVFAGTDIPWDRDKLKLWAGVHLDLLRAPREGNDQKRPENRVDRSTAMANREIACPELRHRRRR